MSESHVETALQWRTQLAEDFEGIQSRFEDLKGAPLSEIGENLDSLGRAIEYFWDRFPCEEGTETFARGIEDDHDGCHEYCTSDDDVVLTTYHDAHDRRSARLVAFSDLELWLTRLASLGLGDLAKALINARADLDTDRFDVTTYPDIYARD